MAKGVRWLFWCNPAGYAYHVLSSLQFHCDAATCPTIPVVTSHGVGTVSVSALMESYLGFNYDNRWVMTWGLLAFIAGFHIITALALAFINHLKR